MFSYVESEVQTQQNPQRGDVPLVESQVQTQQYIPESQQDLFDDEEDMDVVETEKPPAPPAKEKRVSFSNETHESSSGH